MGGCVRKVCHSPNPRGQVLPSPYPRDFLFVKLLNGLVKTSQSQLLRIDRLANRCLGSRRALLRAHFVMRRFEDGLRGAGVSHSRSIKPTVRWFLLALAAATVVLVFVPEVASAQSWWPFGGGDEEERPPPVPREPVYRQPSDVPAPVPQQSP